MLITFQTIWVYKHNRKSQNEDSAAAFEFKTTQIGYSVQDKYIFNMLFIFIIHSLIVHFILSYLIGVLLLNRKQLNDTQVKGGSKFGIF